MRPLVLTCFALVLGSVSAFAADLDESRGIYGPPPVVQGEGYAPMPYGAPPPIRGEEYRAGPYGPQQDIDDDDGDDEDEAPRPGWPDRPDPRSHPIGPRL